MGLTLITGGRGEGKTTFLRAYAAWHAARGDSVGGVASPAVFEGGVRIGYDLVDLRTGQRRLLARVAATDGVAPTIGMYRFDDQAVACGKGAIISAVRDGLEVVAIDEVGQLEFRGGGWSEALRFALAESPRPQELVVLVRGDFVGQLFACFPHSGWQSAKCFSPPWPALGSA